MLPLILAAISAAGGGIKAIQANQERQRSKGIIGRAYSIAEQRQRLQQQGMRQGTAGSVWERGLGQGGGVTAAEIAAGGRGGGVGVAKGTASSSITGARTLGEQIMADLGREHGLETADLASRKEQAYAGVNREADAGIVGGVVDAITGAASTYTGASAPAAGMQADTQGMSPIAAAYGRGTPGRGTPSGASRSLGVSSASSPYSLAWGGIDPVDPLGRGAWSSPGTTGGFNVFNTPSQER